MSHRLFYNYNYPFNTKVKLTGQFWGFILLKTVMQILLKDPENVAYN